MDFNVEEKLNSIKTKLIKASRLYKFALEYLFGLDGKVTRLFFF